MMRLIDASPSRSVGAASTASLVAFGALFLGCGRIGFDLSAESGPLDRDARSGGVGSAASSSDAATSAGGLASSNDGATSAGGSNAGGAVASDGAVSGGANNAGGSSNGSGGAPNTDGATNSGGVTNSGGSRGSGGTNSTDGGTACTVTNGGIEICDGLDNDCNGTVDDGGVCGNQCVGATYGGHAYAFCSTPSGFAAAGSDCASKSMRLARIDDAAENEFLGNLAFAAYGAKNTAPIWPWFGATDRTNPVEWVFADGVVFWSGTKSGTAVGGLYSNWGPANPGDATGTSCVTLSNDGAHSWIDRGCTPATQPYLCEAY